MEVQERIHILHISDSKIVCPISCVSIKLLYYFRVEARSLLENNFTVYDSVFILFIVPEEFRICRTMY